MLLMSSDRVANLQLLSCLWSWPVQLFLNDDQARSLDDGTSSSRDLIFRKSVVLCMPSCRAVSARFQLFRRRAFMRKAASICLNELNAVC